MENKTLQTLKINKDFKNLIRPLQKKEYLQLEVKSFWQMAVAIPLSRGMDL